jgi:proteasome alpha subunit
MERDSVEKIHKVDDHIGIASAGHVADARQLIDFARRRAQVNQLRYAEPIDVETLTKEVTDHIQQYTQVGGARPFGVALIVGGINKRGEPRLYETDPSGTPYEWKALAVGADRGDIREFLEEHYREDLDENGAIGLALRSLASANDGEVRPETVGVATVDAETATFATLTDEEVGGYLRDLDLLAPEEPTDESDDAEDES